MINKSILLLSWRDFYNPKKGGAEVFDYEIFKRLVKKGYKVTWFAPRFDNCKINEESDGINYIRVGKFYSIHLYAYKFLQQHSKEFDIIIDELHGYPFFTNLYLDSPKITIIHEVAGEIWFKMLKFPSSLVGFLFERFYFKFLKNQPFICPSLSTKEDLINQGIGEAKIFTVSEGVNTKKLKNLNYSKNENQLCFVGRICKMKGITDLIEAFYKVQSEIDNSKIILVGKVDESYKKELDYLLDKYSLRNKVEITGFLSDSKKEEIMMKSKYLISCSVKEGFGLIVVEANSLGTPAITYNVNGYKDIINNGVNGFLVPKKNTNALAKTIIDGLRSDKYKIMQKNAFEGSKKYNWDNTANEVELILNSIIKTKDTKTSNKFTKLLALFIFYSSKIFGGLVS